MELGIYYLILIFIFFLIGVVILRWAFRINKIVEELSKIRKLIEDRLIENRLKENLPQKLEELKARENELEKKIRFEVDQIRRLELKEELKKIKDKITQIEKR